MHLTDQQELDNRVAVSVMGLRTELVAGEEFAGPYYRVLDAAGLPVRVLYIPGSLGDMPVARYCASIIPAMEVMEKLRESGKFCCLNMQSDYHYMWDVTLTRASLTPHEISIIATDESLPMAICLAALESAVPVEAEEETAEAEALCH